MADSRDVRVAARNENTTDTKISDTWTANSKFVERNGKSGEQSHIEYETNYSVKWNAVDETRMEHILVYLQSMEHILRVQLRSVLFHYSFQFPLTKYK